MTVDIEKQRYGCVIEYGMGRNKKLRIRLESLKQRITDHQIKIPLEASAYDSSSEPHPTLDGRDQGVGIYRREFDPAAEERKAP